MVLRIKNINYEFVVGFDAEQNSQYLEVLCTDTLPEELVAEMLYSNESKEFTMSCFKENLPLDLIEILINSAKIQLIPTDHSTNA